EFSLKEMLERFRDHRIEVIVRRSRWELERAREEAHILEGLITALANIDEVVRIIRGSREREQAAARLQERFELSERQAAAILQHLLYLMTMLETKNMKERLREFTRRIHELEALLTSKKMPLEVVRDKLEVMHEQNGVARRTRRVEVSEAARL